MSNAIVLACDPSAPGRSNGKQTRKTLLPIRFFKFELKFSIIPTELDNNNLGDNTSLDPYFSKLNVPYQHILGDYLLSTELQKVQGK